MHRFEVLDNELSECFIYRGDWNGLRRPLVFQQISNLGELRLQIIKQGEERLLNQSSLLSLQRRAQLFVIFSAAGLCRSKFPSNPNQLINVPMSPRQNCESVLWRVINSGHLKIAILKTTKTDIHSEQI